MIETSVITPVMTSRKLYKRDTDLISIEVI